LTRREGEARRAAEGDAEWLERDRDGAGGGGDAPPALGGDGVEVDRGGDGVDRGLEDRGEHSGDDREGVEVGRERLGNGVPTKRGGDGDGEGDVLRGRARMARGGVAGARLWCRSAPMPRFPSILTYKHIPILQIWLWIDRLFLRFQKTLNSRQQLNFKSCISED